MILPSILGIAVGNFLFQLFSEVAHWDTALERTVFMSVAVLTYAAINRKSGD